MASCLLLASRYFISVSAAICLLFLQCFSLTVNCMETEKFRSALPGYKFSFPRDHASHDDFLTEWWYFTGHLQTEDKREFGYELTFFRQRARNENDSEKKGRKAKNTYLAHFAITDQQNQKFQFFERLSRTTLDVAGARKDTCYVFNENWSAEQLDDRFVLRADVPEAGVHLLLDPVKPPIVHGRDGVAQKAAGAGHGAHYYSFTRLKTTGVLYLQGKALHVTGITWMDHEFGSNQLSKDEVGWDWFSVQLENNTELMVYRFRNASGDSDSNSFATFVFADGSSKWIPISSIDIKAGGSWKSPTGKSVYPMNWTISIPAIKLKLELVTKVLNQEVVPIRTKGLGYWEGDVKVTGTSEGKSVSGQGYVELTGYGEKFEKVI